MNVEPSGREGQRILSSSDPQMTGPERGRSAVAKTAEGSASSRLDRRAGLSGLLVVLAVALGFVAGGRIGSAADEGAMPAIAAAGPARATGTETIAMVSRERPNRSRSSGVAIDTLPIYGASFDPFSDQVQAALPSVSARGIGGAPSRRRPSDGRTHAVKVTRGQLAPGESLSSALRREGISARTVHVIATEMRGVFDFRDSRPGDRFRLGQDAEGRVVDFRYAQNEEESFHLSWEGVRYEVRREVADLYPVVAKIAGVVDSSFYGAIVALGEQSALASDFARILAWDIDFGRQVHQGDEFQILYERLYRTDEEGRDVYVRPGRILAGRYSGASGDHTVIYFEDDQADGAYFRPDGSSVERAFLVAPLEFSRISSRFTRARVHPILNVTRPHPGIDYAAPHGTPVWAVADGVVEYRARAGASGNLIRIRHSGGLTSHYAHLQGFAEGLKVGDRVTQKQVIGFVGSTGLSTGPHVCFRVKRNGAYVDPMKISSPAAEAVALASLPAFRAVRDRRMADLGAGPIVLAGESL